MGEKIDDISRLCSLLGVEVCDLAFHKNNTATIFIKSRTRVQFIEVKNKVKKLNKVAETNVIVSDSLFQ